MTTKIGLRPQVCSIYELEVVTKLVSQSKSHQDYDETDFKNLIVPPLAWRQGYTYYIEDDLVGFVSIAFTTPETSEGILDGSKQWSPTDWVSGKEAWLVDLIAPFGHGAEIAKHVAGALANQGFRQVYFYREKGERYVRLSIRPTRASEE